MNIINNFLKDIEKNIASGNDQQFAIENNGGFPLKNGEFP